MFTDKLKGVTERDERAAQLLICSMITDIKGGLLYSHTVF